MAGPELFDELEISVNSEDIQTETGGVTLENPLGWEGSTVAATKGPHNRTGKRVVPKVKAKALYNENLTIAKIRGWTDVQITLGKSWGQSRRKICHNCHVVSMGELGNGAVDIEFEVCGEIQEL